MSTPRKPDNNNSINDASDLLPSLNAFKAEYNAITNAAAERYEIWKQGGSVPHNEVSAQFADARNLYEKAKLQYEMARRNMQQKDITTDQKTQILAEAKEFLNRAQQLYNYVGEQLDYSNKINAQKNQAQTPAAQQTQQQAPQQAEPTTTEQVKQSKPSHQKSDAQDRQVQARNKISQSQALIDATRERINKLQTQINKIKDGKISFFTSNKRKKQILARGELVKSLGEETTALNESQKTVEKLTADLAQQIVRMYEIDKFTKIIEEKRNNIDSTNNVYAHIPGYSEEAKRLLDEIQKELDNSYNIGDLDSKISSLNSRLNRIDLTANENLQKSYASPAHVASKPTNTAPADTVMAIKSDIVKLQDNHKNIASYPGGLPLLESEAESLLRRMNALYKTDTNDNIQDMFDNYTQLIRLTTDIAESKKNNPIDLRGGSLISASTLNAAENNLKELNLNVGQMMINDFQALLEASGNARKKISELYNKEPLSRPELEAKRDLLAIRISNLTAAASKNEEIIHHVADHQDKQRFVDIKPQLEIKLQDARKEDAAIASKIQSIDAEIARREKNRAQHETVAVNAGKPHQANPPTKLAAKPQGPEISNDEGQEKKPESPRFR